MQYVILDGDPYYTITDATNATPIVLGISRGSGASHGIPNGIKVVVAGVTGNTAANGTWVTSSATAGNITLDDSVGNGSYVSGGTLTAYSSAQDKFGFPFECTEQLDSLTGTGLSRFDNLWAPIRIRVYVNGLPAGTTNQITLDIYGRVEDTPWVIVASITESDTWVDCAVSGGEAGYYTEVSVAAANMLPVLRWKMTSETDAATALAVTKIVALSP